MPAPAKPDEAPATPAKSAEPAKSAAPVKAAPPAKPAAKPKCKSGMVGIPTGTFMMGDEEHKDFLKVGEVTVEAFCMDRTEVTTAAYAKCVKAGKCTTTGEFGNANDPKRGNHPINDVDWHQATAYCAAQGLRLPAEEEWEYAARGTDGRKFPWGSDGSHGEVCFMRDRHWTEGGGLGTCAVSSHPKGNSPFGLADMTGNVAEWTSSQWSSADADRVTRGGGWGNVMDIEQVMSAIRSKEPPEPGSRYIGFRCAGSFLP